MASEPAWVAVQSSNVGAVRFWSQHPEQGRSVLEVYFYTSDMTYGYAATHQTYHALLRSGSKGNYVHRILKPRGYLFKRSGQ